MINQWPQLLLASFWPFICHLIEYIWLSANAIVVLDGYKCRKVSFLNIGDAVEHILSQMLSSNASLFIIDLSENYIDDSCIDILNDSIFRSWTMVNASANWIWRITKLVLKDYEHLLWHSYLIQLLNT